MIYAPIVIPTLNRAEHLKRCIESLARNPEAKETELYLGVDYPPSEKYREGYEKIIEYVDGGIEGFKNVIIVKRDVNYGSTMNKRLLREMVYEKYDRCITTEDDNEFADCFLGFVNEALERYKDDDSISAVYGFKPKVKDLESAEGNAFLTTYYSAYGTGIWRDKERKLRSTLNRNYIEDLCCSRSKLKKLKNTYPDAISFLCSTLLRKEAVYRRADGSVPLIDTVRMIYSIVEDKYLVCSPLGMVKNWGYDGSGVNCSGQYIPDVCRVSLDEVEKKHVGFSDDIKKLKLNYPLRKNRVIPYISAWVRIWIWRLIAKRKVVD